VNTFTCVHNRPAHTNLLYLARWSLNDTTLLDSSIFRASAFGRWVFTHSLADTDLHGHRTTVLMQQRPFGILIYVAKSSYRLIRLNPLCLFCLPKRGPLKAFIDETRFSVDISSNFIVCEWEKANSHAPNHWLYPTRLWIPQLSLGKFRFEPATRRFDWSFAAIPRSDERFARQHRTRPSIRISPDFSHSWHRSPPFGS